jgi:hypothetical protein
MRRLLLLAAFAAVACGSRAPKEETMAQLRERVFAVAQAQAVYMDSLLMAKMPGQAGHDGEVNVMAGPDRPSLCPRTFQGDTLVTSDIGWWTSGFYSGVLWEIFKETGDERFRNLAIKHTRPLAGLLDRETDHDIGFQLMGSFGKWWVSDLATLYNRDVLPLDEIKDVLDKGVKKLARRFLPETGVIRSWNGARWNFPVIIDNMMNLELLMFYGRDRDREIAEKHALTTMKNHFRDDGTCFHLVDYADDGSILGKQTVQGYADDTAWARGQAWALYGYAMMAQEETRNQDMRETFYGVAAKLESWLLANLPEDGIPYWDFSQSDYKDASAGAIIACGLLKMWRLRDCPADDPALTMAERILRTLASPEYLAEPRTNGGFLLKHGVGNLPGHSEVDVPLTYADYYFLEALTLFPVSATSLKVN